MSLFELPSVQSSRTSRSVPVDLMTVSWHLRLSPCDLSVNGSSASFSGVRQSLWVTVLATPLACFFAAASNRARWAGVILAANSGGRPMLPLTVFVFVVCQRPVFTFSLIFPPATRAKGSNKAIPKAIIFLIFSPAVERYFCSNCLPAGFSFHPTIQAPCHRWSRHSDRAD